MTHIKDIIRHLEALAPKPYQESYDNSGLLTGHADAEVQAVLITLDTTEEVVEEAIAKKCNLIISHHPVIFKAIRSLTGKNDVERTIIRAIKNDIAIYAIHTNLDNVAKGVNKKICDKIGLLNTHILAPKAGTLSKLTTYVEEQYAEAVKTALFAAGAGDIGNYSGCSFEVSGTGQFTPGSEANPAIGSKNIPEKVREARIEVLLPRHRAGAVLSKLKEAHPYEEVAYYLMPLDNTDQHTGSGMIGELAVATDAADFMHSLKEKMDLKVIKHTAFTNKKAKKIAVCGGAGSFLLPRAIHAGADVFVSSDFKYHDFFGAEGKVVVADIGHYESEVFTKELLHELLNEKFSKLATHKSNIVTNPISYL